MLETIKREIRFFTEEPKLQSLVALLLIGRAGFKSAEMLVSDDLAIGLVGVACLVSGVLVEISSYIKKDATHLHRLRLMLLSLALLAHSAICFIASDMYFVHKFFN